MTAGSGPARASMRRVAILLLGLVVLAGCGGDDASGDEGEKKPKAAPQGAVEAPAGLSGEEKKVAAGVTELLEQKSGADACFDSLGAQYVESLGGSEKCGPALDPLVTGDYNKVASIKVVKPGSKAEAEVTPTGGGDPVTLELTFASPGAWNVTGASELPR